MKTKWITRIAVGLLMLGQIAQASSGWETDYAKAVTKAKAENKPMLVDFSGSDWCGWCIKLDKEVFSKQAFKDYAKENLVTVLLDFPRDTSKIPEAQQAANQALMKKHGVRGFPTVLIISPEGEVIAKTGYQAGGPEKYVEHLKELLKKPEAKAEAK